MTIEEAQERVRMAQLLYDCSSWRMGDTYRARLEQAKRNLQDLQETPNVCEPHAKDC